MKPLIGINSPVRLDEKYPYEDLNSLDFYKVPCKYVEAITGAGGTPAIVPCLGNELLLKKHLMGLDGFLFIGGEDLPPELYGQERDPNVVSILSPRHVKNDMFLARTCLKSDIPVLGICLGCQLLNVAAGGGLIQHLETTSMHRGKTGDLYHDLTVLTDSRLMQILGKETANVNSRHHQAVKPDAVGSGFSTVAYASDGTIEAIEMKDRKFALGVQWHPERMADDENRRRIFSAFIEACRK